MRRQVNRGWTTALSMLPRSGTIMKSCASTKLQSVGDQRLGWCANTSTEFVNQNHRLGCQTIRALLSIRLGVNPNRVLRATRANEATRLRTIFRIFLRCHGIHRSLECDLQRHWSRGSGFVVIRCYHCSCDNVRQRKMMLREDCRYSRHANHYCPHQ